MANVVLVHWNEQEAKERARALKALGYKAKILFDPEKHSLAEIREHPPELFLIDLSRLPSQGREIAGHFRRAKATRNVPILFVGGDAERVKTARKLILDAEFATWEEIRAAIKRAIKNAPQNPSVPSTMASYSASVLPKKLGIRANCSIKLINPPNRFERKLDPLPAYTKIIDDPTNANVAVLFALSLDELARDFPLLAKDLPEKSALWIAWPKKASGVKTDLDGNIVREFGLDAGWVDYKVCAIDETWSALCFARRKSPD
jgi:CheY-like chemotaxis protein